MVTALTTMTTTSTNYTTYSKYILSFNCIKIEIDYEMYIRDGSHGCITIFGFLKEFAPLYNNIFVRFKTMWKQQILARASNNPC